MEGKMRGAPFSEEEVEALEEFQRGAWDRDKGYVCDQCRRSYTTALRPKIVLLKPTPEGMVCPQCGDKETEVYEEHLIKPFKHNGRLRDGMDCPKCIHDGKTGDEVGIFRISSPFDSVPEFRCTKCRYSQYGYDNIAIMIGAF